MGKKNKAQNEGVEMLKKSESGGASKKKKKGGVSSSAGGGTSGGTMRNPADSRFVSLRGHVGEVMDVAFSADGKKLISSGSGDHLAFVWSAGSGQLLNVLRGHTDEVFSGAFSPDGAHILTSSGDKTVRLWDPSTSKCTQVLEGHNEWVWHVEPAPSGAWFVSASNDTTACIWAYGQAGKEPLAVLRGHSGPLRQCAVSADSKFVATASYDLDVRLWSIVPGALDGNGSATKVRAIQVGKIDGAHTSAIYSVAFDPTSSNRLATAGLDSEIRFWHSEEVLVTTRRKQRRRKKSKSRSRKTSNGEDDAGDVDPELGAGVADGDQPPTNKSSKKHKKKKFVWSLEASMSGHKDGIRGVRWSKDGQMIVSGANDKLAIVWSATTFQQAYQLPGHTAHLQGVAFNPDLSLKQVASASGDGSVRLWHYDRGAAVSAIRVAQHQQQHRKKAAAYHDVSLLSCAFAPRNRSLLAVSSAEGFVALVDTLTGAVTARLGGGDNDNDDDDDDGGKPSGKLTSVVFRPAPAAPLLLAAGGDSGVVHVWDVSEQKLVCQLVRNSPRLQGRSELRAVAWSPDGSLIACAQHWSVAVWTAPHSNNNNDDNGGGSGLANVQRDEKLADDEPAELLLVFNGHMASVESVIFNNDSRRVISCSDDFSVRIWALLSDDDGPPRCLHELRRDGHSNNALAVIVGRSENELVTSGQDEKLKVWDVSAGRAVATMEAHRNAVTCLAVVKGGAVVVAGSWDGTVRAFDLATRKMLPFVFNFDSEVYDVTVYDDAQTAVKDDDGNTATAVNNVMTVDGVTATVDNSGLVLMSVCCKNGKVYLVELDLGWAPTVDEAEVAINVSKDPSAVAASLVKEFPAMVNVLANTDGLTLVHRYSQKHHANVVAALCGSPLYALSMVSQDGRNALDLALDQNDYQTARTLVDRFIEFGRPVDLSLTIVRLANTFPDLAVTVLTNSWVSSARNPDQFSAVLPAGSEVAGSNLMSGDLVWDGVNDDLAVSHPAVPARPRFCQLVNFIGPSDEPLSETPFHALAHSQNIALFGDESPMIAAVRFKWQTLGRRLWLRGFVVYLIHLALMLVAVFLVRDYWLLGTVPGPCADAGPLASHRSLLNYLDNDGSLGWAAVISLGVSSLSTLYHTVREIVRVVRAPSLGTHFRSFWNCVNALLLLSCIAFSALAALTSVQPQGAVGAEQCLVPLLGPLRSVSATAAILVILNLLSFARAHPISAPLVAMTLAITQDIMPFLLIQLVVLTGFASAFALLMPLSDDFGGAVSLLGVFRMMMGDFDVSQLTSNPYAVVLFILYMLGVVIIMLNLLIALMSDTYDRMRETQDAEAFMQLALQLCAIEVNNGRDRLLSLQPGYFPRFVHEIRPVSSMQDDGEWSGRMKALTRALQKGTESVMDRIGSTQVTLATKVDGLQARALETEAQFVNLQKSLEDVKQKCESILTKINTTSQ